MKRNEAIKLLWAVSTNALNLHILWANIFEYPRVPISGDVNNRRPSDYDRFSVN